MASLLAGTFWAAYVSASLLLTLAAARGFSVRENLESNEVHHRQESDRSSTLPVCRSQSVCAYLQANTRGINVQQMCSCPGARNSCPLSWDSMDGHSITQGSDQYKFCERVPEQSRCNLLIPIAYTTRMEYSKITGDMETFSNHLHCHCPNYFGYELLDTKFDETEEIDIIETFYACNLLKTCEPTDSCRVVTETADTYLVKNLCTCPQGLTCPSNARYAVESTTMEKGTVNLIRCQ